MQCNEASVANLSTEFDEIIINRKVIELDDGCRIIYGQLNKCLQPTENEKETLWSERPLQRHMYTMYGKQIPAPRFFKFYSSQEINVGFGGQSFHSDARVNTVEYGNRILESMPLKYGYNSMLLNWYMTEKDYVAFHGDKERGLVQTTPIISISIGGSRRFQIMKNDKTMVFDQMIHDNDVIIMQGQNFQYKYKHSIKKALKRDGVVNPRINITLRRYIC